MRRTPGSHEPNNKNRSSKHLSCMTGYRPIIRTLSNAALAEMQGAEAKREIERRKRKNEKKGSKGTK